MKKIIYVFVLLLFCSIGKSQNIIPNIKIYINNAEINYAMPNNSIQKNDNISFEVINKTDRRKINIDDFTISFFSSSGYADKLGRLDKQFSNKFATKGRMVNQRVNFTIKELLSLHPFTRIELEIGKPYLLNRNMRSDITFHSSKRTFSFILINTR